MVCFCRHLRLPCLHKNINSLSLPLIFHSGYGYPALVSLSPSKGKYSSLRSAYEEAHVLEFIEAVRTGRERVEDVHGALATPATTDPWNGEAGHLEVEEEFSLEDLMGSD